MTPERTAAQDVDLVSSGKEAFLHINYLREQFVVRIVSARFELLCTMSTTTRRRSSRFGGLGSDTEEERPAHSPPDSDEDDDEPMGLVAAKRPADKQAGNTACC